MCMWEGDEIEKQTENYNVELWKGVIANGQTKEKGTRNYLCPSDVRAILGSLECFGVDRPMLAQVHWDLLVPRYRVFDWLGMALQGRYKRKQDPVQQDNENIFVALSNVYIHTTYVPQWVDYLRYTDLELDQGSFNSLDFKAKIEQWNSDDLKATKEGGRKKGD
jgi:hypothetical protein